MPISKLQIDFRVLLVSLAAITPMHGQAPSATLAAGTPLAVRLVRHTPMRAGETIRTQLIYPVYAENQLLLPANTTVIGTVVSLNPNHSQRVNARFNGDFTPFRVPVVRFDQIALSNGDTVHVDTINASDGAPLLRLTAPSARNGGFIHRQWNSGMQMLHGQVALITAPEKGDRLLQLFYNHLPYHPQRIETGTSWTVETASPMAIPSPPPPPSASGNAAAAGSNTSNSWIIQAYLENRLSSQTASIGEPIKALVAEPVYNQDHTIAIPQGAILVGAVTKAAPARSFSRAGRLGFDFKQVILPDGQIQNVQSALKGVDAASAANLAMDSEGKVAPKPQDKIVVPLILALLATRPLDQDGGGQLGKNFVGANGFGLAGNIIGLAGGSPELSAAIGAYGTALSIYRRWIARGTEVTFVRDTRLVLEATPRNASVLKPEQKQTRQ
jgi:hypothetical protein